MNTTEVRETLYKVFQFCTLRYKEMMANQIATWYLVCQDHQRNKIWEYRNEHVTHLFVTPSIVSEYLLGREPQSEEEEAEMESVLEYILSKEWDSIRLSEKDLCVVSARRPFFFVDTRLKWSGKIVCDVVFTDPFLVALATYFGPIPTHIKEKMETAKIEFYRRINKRK